MANTYIDNAFRTVFAQNPALSAEHDASKFIFEGQGKITAHGIVSNYTVRNMIVKQHNNLLVGYDELEKKLLQLPENQSMEFAHYEFKDESNFVIISLFFKDSELFGYFYYVKQK